MYFNLLLLLLPPNSPFESLEAFLKPWALNFFQSFSNGLFGRSHYKTRYFLFYFCPIFTYKLCNIPLKYIRVQPRRVTRQGSFKDKVLAKYVGLVWMLVYIKHLYLSNMWQGLWSRMGTRFKVHSSIHSMKCQRYMLQLLMRLNYVLKI